MGHTAAANPMLIASWVNDSFVVKMRKVKYPEGQTSFSLLRPAGEVQVGKFGTAQYGNKMLEFGFNHKLATEFTVPDLSFDIDADALAFSYLRPAVDDLLAQYQKVIDIGKPVMVFGRLPLNSRAAEFGARVFRCDYNDVSFRTICQYDALACGVKVTIEAVIGLEKE